MRKTLRWAGYIVGSLLILALATIAAFWILGGLKLHSHATLKPESLVAPTSQQVADAQRQIYVLRCVGCHNKGLRGDLFFEQPFVGKIYAPNLPEVAAKASDQQLAQAIRQGVGTDGRSLVIMPSATFARLNDNEVAALIAVIRSLPRVGEATPRPEIGILGRVGLVTGKFNTTPEQVEEYAHAQPIDLGPQYAAGRHMAASNCAECHGRDLGGGEAEPGLNAPDLTIAGAYDLAAFKTLVRTGVPPGGRKLKLMSDIARGGLDHMTDAEIDQLFAYLQARAQRLSR